ncbi:pyridoxamine 5'-phosphate oxidase-like protein [Mycolicibacterium fortuitum]|uniref:Pyridoxamine 5'-phosphate oxidase-like protein n=4 Tax=Mycolicibacterium fortuitum TaxID=1766 RepID=A0A378UXZ0_MYCFO|nr:DNA-binding protein [Mycolicibacterium fortuitum subsp. fortuitum]CRL55923.1 pyridoxamine 5'-phosphate oxidase-like protein [Mycolicibacterium fortuitum subsp. fortuitum DSM 46621 = ATCC 6841 = JCM 6387]CRL78702.1 pyridoxamine 5'-phosphate oxidase-like protein [Mycolicibacter nonchromogenicus]SUA02993.1 pyridoxamine 5'-phosphate oxidase-like protein [Mycolicibacterium fortuitum]
MSFRRYGGLMTAQGPVSVLGEHECWQLLSSVTLGRLVSTMGTRLEIFPVNYVVQRRTVLFRTAEGTKLISTLFNDRVLFEADDHNVAGGWSVIVRGEPRLLEAPDEIAEAERGQLLSWIGTTKRRYVRIEPKEISGRRFVFGAPVGDG